MERDVMTFEINKFDESYEMCGSEEVTLTRDQIADIVNHALQVILIGWGGDVPLEVNTELEDALEVAGLLDSYQ